MAYNTSRVSAERGEDSERARTRARRAIVTRAAIAWGTAFLLAIASASVTYAFASEYDAAIERFAEETETQRALAEVLQLMTDAETAQRGYALTGDRAFLAPYESAADALPASLGALHAWLGKQGEDADAARLEAAIRARQTFASEIVDLVRAGRRDDALARIATGEGRVRMDRVRAIVREIDERRERSIAELALRIRRARVRTGVALAVGALFTLLIAAGALTTVRRDLHAMDAAARALEEGERRFRVIAETSADLIRVHERAGRIVYASPSSSRLLGYTPDELIALEDAGSLIASEDRERVLDVVQACIARGEAPPPIVHRLRRKDGALRSFETRIEPIVDGDGEVRRYHSASRDVTARVEAERGTRERAAELAREAQQLREISNRDELTGLLNRRGLFEHGAALLEAARDAERAAVAYFVDLDGLKQINDVLGHEAGDQAIRDGARVLKDIARGSDLIARLGGDELVVLGVVRDATAAQVFAQRIADRVATFNVSEDRPYRLSMSVGLATWSAADGALGIQDLIARARRRDVRAEEVLARAHDEGGRADREDASLSAAQGAGQAALGSA